MADLLGRAERSSPEALQGRAAGTGLDGKSARRAIIDRAAMRAFDRVVCSGHCCLADGRIWLQPSGSTLALRDAIAFAVHFENVDVMGEAIEQGAGQSLGTEHAGPLIEWQVTGHEGRGPVRIAG